MTDDLIKMARDDTMSREKFYEVADQLCRDLADRVEEAEAKLSKAVGIIRFYTTVIDANISPNETGENRLLLNGEYYTGPVVDWVHETFSKLLEINTATLAEFGDDGNENMVSDAFEKQKEL